MKKGYKGKAMIAALLAGAGILAGTITSYGVVYVSDAPYDWEDNADSRSSGSSGSPGSSRYIDSGAGPGAVSDSADGQDITADLAVTQVNLTEQYHDEYKIYEESINNQFFFYTSISNGGITDQNVTLDMPHNLFCTVEKDGIEYDYVPGQVFSEYGTYVVRVTAVEDTSVPLSQQKEYRALFRFRIQAKPPQETEGGTGGSVFGMTSPWQESGVWPGGSNGAAGGESGLSGNQPGSPGSWPESMGAGEMPAGEGSVGGMATGETPAGGTATGETSARGTAAGETPAGEMSAGETFAGETATGEMSAGETADRETAGEESETGETAKTGKENQENAREAGKEGAAGLYRERTQIYDRLQGRYEVTFGNGRTLHSNVPEGYMGQGTVELLVSEGEGSIYRNDEPLEYGASMTLKEPGFYRLDLDGQTWSFAIASAVGAVDYYMAPAGMEFTEVSYEGEPKELSGGKYLSMREDGQYQIRMAGEEGESLEVFLKKDTQPPQVAVSVKGGTAQIQYGSDDIAEVILEKNGELQEGFAGYTIDSPGSYRLTAVDEAGNASSTEFFLRYQVNMYGIVAVLMVILLIVGGVVFVIHVKRTVRVR